MPFIKQMISRRIWDVQMLMLTWKSNLEDVMWVNVLFSKNLGGNAGKGRLQWDYFNRILDFESGYLQFRAEIYF